MAREEDQFVGVVRLPNDHGVDVSGKTKTPPVVCQNDRSTTSNSGTRWENQQPEASSEGGARGNSGASTGNTGQDGAQQERRNADPQNAQDDDEESLASSSSSSSSSSESESSSSESGSGNGSDDDDDESESSTDTDESPQGTREEQEAYRKLSVDKELFHLLHKISANDPTATSLSLLPEADRVLTSCDWDTATLLTHKHSNRPLTRRELLTHVARQMELQQPQFGLPTGAHMLQEALAKQPLFLRELQLYIPLAANRLDGEGHEILALFLSQSTCLQELTLFHTSALPGRMGDNQQRLIPALLAAVSQSVSIRKLALRKLSLPAVSDCAGVLGDTKTLEEFELAYCALHPDVCESIKRGLAKNSSLIKLTVQKDLNDVNPSFLPFWEGLRESCAPLQELSVEMMTCQQDELVGLGQCVEFSPKLESLSLIVASNTAPTNQRPVSVAVNGVQNTEQGNNGNRSPPELDVSAFFKSLVRNRTLRKLRFHPYVALKDEEETWRTLLDDGTVDSFDLGQGLSRQANPGTVKGVMDSLLGPKQHIRHLNMSNASCHGELSLRRVLSETANQTLTKLYLRNCRLMDSDCEEIANGLRESSNSSLTELDLGSNYIGFCGLECLARSVSQNGGVLESLDLSFNSFGHFSCVRSFAKLLKSKTLAHLDVSCTDMFVEHSSSGHGGEELMLVAEELRQAVAQNKALTRLAADDNGFTDALVIAFLVGLSENRRLKELSIDGNSLRLATVESRKCLVEMLSKNKTLSALNLPRNRGMTEVGFRALASGVKRNKSLTRLAVRVLCVEALPKLLNAIVHSNNLVKLTVALPSSPDRVQAESRILSLIKAVGKVKTFQHLNISNTEQHLISPATGKILLDILRKNPSFQSFNLSLCLCPFELRMLIEFFVELNKRGRRFLDASLQQPAGLWPHILAPLTGANRGCAMYLYFFVREHIATHQRQP